MSGARRAVRRCGGAGCRRASLPRRRSCSEPSSAGVTVAGSSSATTRPRSITSRRSDSPISSSRSAEIEQRGQARRRGRRAGCPRSPPGRRRRRRGSGGRRRSTFGLGRHLAPDDQLLLVAARQREARHVDARACARRSSATISLVRRRAPPRSTKPPLSNGGLRLVAEQHVLPQRERRAPCRRAGGPRGCSRCRPSPARQRAPGGDVARRRASTSPASPASAR